MKSPIFAPSAQGLLFDLLKIDTQSPLETGRLARIDAAQRRLTDYACNVGLEIAHFDASDYGILGDHRVPHIVAEAARRFGKEFWNSQPNLVLRAGKPQPIEKTILINFHIDTVEDWWPPELVHGIITARGAADAKGPGVAALAGVIHAVRTNPAILDRIQILIQSVCGEEGGAMGIYGTREVFDRGFCGRLNIFAEPSGGVYFDSATSTATAQIEVNGHDATDDAPAQGDNATLILSELCARMSSRLSDDCERAGYRMCVSGLHTGFKHNRVYGSGQLHFNFAYSTVEGCRAIESLVEQSYSEALGSIARDYRSKPLFAHTAERAADITRLRWLKRGLPVLANRDLEMENILAQAGLARCPPHRLDLAFTCDAIWGQGQDRYSIVYGPGDLAANHAHAREEFIAVAALESYAADIAAVVTRFAETQDIPKEVR